MSPQPGALTLQVLARVFNISTEQSQTAAPADKPKSWWQKLKEEDEQRKKNNIIYSSEEATRITGYNSAGKAATQERKDEQRMWETGEKQVGTYGVYRTMLRCAVM